MKALAWLKAHKPEAGLGAAGIVVTIALYVRQKNAAANSTTGSTASTQEPTSVDDTSGTDAYNGLEDQILGLQQAIVGLGATAGAPATGVNPGGTANVSSGSVASTPAQAVIQSLPWVGPQSEPNIIEYGDYQPGQFEVVGQETNGVYSGDQIAGGVPLFGTAFGGLFQNFGLKGGPAPNYTGPVYAPTADAAYIGYTGQITGAP